MRKAFKFILGVLLLPLFALGLLWKALYKVDLKKTVGTLFDVGQGLVRLFAMFAFFWIAFVAVIFVYWLGWRWLLWMGVL